MRSLSPASRFLVPLLVVIGGAVTLAAPATAEPEDTGASAQSVIDSLKTEGYNVEINWLTGYDTDRCRCAQWKMSTTPAIPRPGRGR